MKRILAFILTFVLLVCFALPMSVSATITTYNGKLDVYVCNTQSSSPVYNYAWLDKLILRDDASAVSSALITPKAEYPYSETYDEFIHEVDVYSDLNMFDEKTAVKAYEEAFRVMYYTVVALGLTDDTETMVKYLYEYGIDLPEEEPTGDEMMNVAIVYAMIKYNASYVLYEKNLVIPKGTTIDGAMVIILASLVNGTVPYGVDDLSSYAVASVKIYVQSFDQIPISEDPTEEEVFYWAKVITANASGYSVPTDEFTTVTQAQRDYVDYAYFATILNTLYSIKMDPVKLAAADQTKDEEKVARVILTTMLDESKVSYSLSSSTKQLFDLACENGHFDLEQELYSDVYNYDLQVSKDCTKLWFTPFAVASQLENGNNEYVKIKFSDGTIATSNQTVGIPLDKAKSNETISITLTYNDLDSINQEATYTFNIKKVSESESNQKDDVVSKVEGLIGSVIPSDSEKGNYIVDNVLGAVDNAVNNGVDKEYVGDLLTTFGVEVNEDGTGLTAVGSKDETESTSSYLDELLGEQYDENTQTTVSNYISTSMYETVTTTQPQNIVQAATQAVKENPEIIVAPTGVLLAGSLAGYFFKKRKVTDDELEIMDTKKEN